MTGKEIIERSADDLAKILGLERSALLAETADKGRLSKWGARFPLPLVIALVLGATAGLLGPFLTGTMRRPHPPVVEAHSVVAPPAEDRAMTFTPLQPNPKAKPSPDPEESPAAPPPVRREVLRRLASTMKAQEPPASPHNADEASPMELFGSILSPTAGGAERSAGVMDVTTVPSPPTLARREAIDELRLLRQK